MRINSEAEDRHDDDARQGTAGPLDVVHNDPNDLSEFNPSLPLMPADRAKSSGGATPSAEPQTAEELERAKNPLGYTVTAPTEAEIDGK